MLALLELGCCPRWHFFLVGAAKDDPFFLRSRCLQLSGPPAPKEGAPPGFADQLTSAGKAVRFPVPVVVGRIAGFLAAGLYQPFQ